MSFPKRQKLKGQISMEMMIIYGIAIIIAIVGGFLLFGLVKNAQKSVGTSLGNNLNTQANFVATPIITSASITGNLLTAKINFDNGNPAVGMSFPNFLINGSGPTDISSVNNTYNITVPGCDIDFVVINTNNAQQSEKIVNNCIVTPPAPTTFAITSLTATNAGNNVTNLVAQLFWSNGSSSFIPNLGISDFQVSNTTGATAVNSVTGNNPYTLSVLCDNSTGSWTVMATAFGQTATNTTPIAATPC